MIYISLVLGNVSFFKSLLNISIVNLWTGSTWTRFQRLFYDSLTYFVAFVCVCVCVCLRVFVCIFVCLHKYAWGRGGVHPPARGFLNSRILWKSTKLLWNTKFPLKHFEGKLTSKATICTFVNDSSRKSLRTY